jgi:hypothetical protein
MAKGHKTGGRQKGTPNKRRSDFVSLITTNNRHKILVDRLFELAEGIVVQDAQDGEPRVYSRAPDQRAASYLLDQAFGKPTQPVEVSDPGKNFDASTYLDE